jgi:pimeloyl-ACP methyl ester carboxylesterase
MIVRSNDAEIFYNVQGDGAPVVLLHPFPANHRFWLSIIELLSSRYRFIVPDLRGLGASTAGDGPATMQKHAEDIRRVCDDAEVGKPVFIGVSMGGYILFEFWRRFRERVGSVVFSNTKAGADTDEARNGRLESAEQVLQRGPEFFIDVQLPKLIGETTRRNRPDLVDEARRMMMSASATGIAENQQGMAARPDSSATLPAINVPALFVGGFEDVLTPPEEIERMHKAVRGSQVRIIPTVGHYAAFERPDEYASILREFLGSIQHSG